MSEEIEKSLSKSSSDIDLKPLDPIMGAFIEQNPPGSGKWNIRMGGKPNADWTGLDVGETFKSTPFHFRRPEMTSDSKGYLVRSTGLSTKFKANDDVLQLQVSVWKHLTSHGLDTISYLRDPIDSSKVLDVIRNHARFSSNLKNAKVLSTIFSERFDEQDQSNDSAAKAFLLDSLEFKFSQVLERKIKDDDSFAMVW